jgi:hypothetical protein
MEKTFEKLDYNNTWGQYTDIEASAIPVAAKAIIKKNLEPIKPTEPINLIKPIKKEEEAIQSYHVSNNLTKFQFCIFVIILYLTCHVILIF